MKRRLVLLSVNFRALVINNLYHEKQVRITCTNYNFYLLFAHVEPLLPKPQPLHNTAGILVLPIHLPHFAQLSFLLPKLQLLQDSAGYPLLPTHFPQTYYVNYLI